MKNVYTHLGHGRDIVSGDPLPVPEGCVYVTIALCGEISQSSHKIMKAFEDPALAPALRDPVKHLKRLTDYFGKTLHVHYPEAEEEASRTYYDTTYNPFLANTVKDEATCFSKKSGLFKLGDLATYRAPGGTVSAKVQADLRPYVASFPCDSIGENIVKHIYKGSLYPTLEQMLAEYDAAPKPLGFAEMRAVAKKYRYKQSWAFSLWPGVHYNFVCRGKARAEENISHSGTRKRRVNSAEAAAKLLGKGGGRTRNTSAARTRPYRTSSSSGTGPRDSS